MKKLTVFSVIIAFFISGCVSTVRKSPHFDDQVRNIKTIAVMPPDITVYQLTAGGIQEEIDAWTAMAKDFIGEALKEHLSGQYGFEIKFIDESWIKENYKELWNNNRALYEAIGTSALLHAYSGSPHSFRDKIKNFDYTLGTDISKLAEACGADTLMFVYGFDNEATAGRNALIFWDVLIGAATGVMILPTNPSGLIMGLVNGDTGDVGWFKTSVPGSEYSFRKKEHMDTLVEWFMRDFIEEE